MTLVTPLTLFCISDLLPLPEKLRQVLKYTLAEEPTPDNWEKHKPNVGAIVKKLLICVIEKDGDNRLTMDVCCPSKQDALEDLGGDSSLVVPSHPIEVADEPAVPEAYPTSLGLTPSSTITFSTRVVLLEVPNLDSLVSSATLVEVDSKQADLKVKEMEFKRFSIIARLRERISLAFGSLDAKYKKTASLVDSFA